MNACNTHPTTEGLVPIAGDPETKYEYCAACYEKDRAIAALSISKGFELLIAEIKKRPGPRFVLIERMEKSGGTKRDIYINLDQVTSVYAGTDSAVNFAAGAGEVQLILNEENTKQLLWELRK